MPNTGLGSQKKWKRITKMVNPPKWKKWLSYLVEQHVESVEGTLNPSLHVSLVNGRYQLSTDTAVYSFDDLYDNFTTAFEQTDLKSFQPKSVLILGLGLGSVPYILETKYKIQPTYTAVELDEAVIYLAEKYRLAGLKAPVQCIAADAEVFVSINTELFDLIVIDIFIDDLIPEPFLSEEFMTQIKGMLNTNGLVMFNHMAMDKEQKERSVQYLEQVMRPLFPSATYIETRNNHILVNTSQYLK